MHKLHKDYAKSLACQHNGSGIPAAQTRGFRTQHSFIKEHDNVRHRHHPPLGVPPARGSCPNDPRVRQLNDARATRKALSKLSDRELDDIGLTRGDIDAVARKL